MTDIGGLRMKDNVATSLPPLRDAPPSRNLLEVPLAGRPRRMSNALRDVTPTRSLLEPLMSVTGRPRGPSAQSSSSKGNQRFSRFLQKGEDENLPENVLRFVYSMAIERALGNRGVPYFVTRPPTQDPLRRKASDKLEPELPALDDIQADFLVNPVRINRPTRLLVHDGDSRTLRRKISSVFRAQSLKDFANSIREEDQMSETSSVNGNNKDSLSRRLSRRHTRPLLLKLPPLTVSKKHKLEQSLAEEVEESEE